ncbi:MAG TPA: DUF3108 domain-containing protein [Gammaproteobacteria bacterium]|nr:DUF3108 domain-containing protein [Gammaproteobacteria bacterium]
MTIKNIFILVITTAALHFTAVAQAADAPLPFYQATYEVSHGSIHAANTRFTLERGEKERYVYHSKAWPVGLLALFRDDVITEKSIFTLHDDDIRPLTFKYRHQGSDENRRQTLQFDWTADVVHSNYRGDKATIALESGMLDHLLVQLAVMRDVAANSLPEEYVVLDRNVVKHYQVKRTGKADVETQAGTFNTVIVQRLDDDKTVLFWLAPKLNYVPVRMELREPDESTITMELIDYKEL